MPNYVNTLIASGLDSFTNLYDIQVFLPTQVLSVIPSNRITGTSNGIDNPSIADNEMANRKYFQLRIGDFQGPQPKLAQYQTDYQTIQITRFAPMMEFERKFDLTFRVDTNYFVYHLLKQWAFLYHDALNGGINLPYGTESTITGDIKVKSYSPNNMAVSNLWTYNGVICNKVTDPNFTRAGTEPVTITASFMFFDYLPTILDENATQLEGTLIE